MIKAIAVLLFFVLTAIAALHAYWAMGGLWPGASERELIDTVVGDPRMEQMPAREVTLAVAGLLIFCGVIALAAGGVFPAPVWLTSLLGVGAGLLFLARGAAGFFFEKVAWETGEPFTSMNVRFYSPLCLVIGAGFFALVAARLLFR
ncbi:MAG: DUF3995 domain-containing protein [Pseudomonadota bacterium]